MALRLIKARPCFSAPFTFSLKNLAIIHFIIHPNSLRSFFVQYILYLISNLYGSSPLCSQDRLLRTLSQQT